mmetsp:Transcript_15947/g.47884  ORF Transcript_15947/g.47884 Transcript_15947/m.47884 type:complete len:206 (+) Transcript_15947:67-684(+)
MPGIPPKPLVGAEDLLPISSAADVELALGALLALQVLNRRVVLEDKLHVEPDEVRQGAEQKHRHEERNANDGAGDAVPGSVHVVQGPRQMHEAIEELRDGEADDHNESEVHIAQQLDEELPVVEANAVVDPRAVVVHVQDAAIADAAMVGAVGLPDIAHLAVSSALGLVTHVEAPVGGHDARVGHDALVEREDQVREEDVVDEED